ncbi:MAG: hypothetical protein AMS24_04690 [Chlamydiae bacterium SM23_39]|nr:MAG: hypothetical protein AMS24_04690 [Chlamydiae bacterium SM23_39]
MYSLLIEISTKKSLLAINKNDLSIKKYNNFDNKNIFFIIKNLLKNTNLTLKDLSFIAFGKGPGSFTSIRIAASIAKTLSYSLDIPLISFSSLKSFIPKIDGPFLSIIDCKSNGIYCIKGDKNKKNILYTSNTKIISLDKLKNFLQLKYTILSFNGFFNSIETDPNENHLAKISFQKFKNQKFSKLELCY